MNDRGVHPYRQPQEPEKPPGDPMRVVIFVAGGLAALIALVAIAAGVSERFATKTEQPVATTPRAEASEAQPVERSSPPQVEKPPPPRAFPDGPLTFVASAGACFGNCLEHTTRIDDEGHVTLSMSRMRGPICSPRTSVVTRADLDALAAHARSIGMETMPASYVHMTDVQTLTTEVSGRRDSIAIQHLHADDASAAAAIDGLHRHIERLAGTDEWIKTCKRTETARKAMGSDVNSLLDTR